MKTNVVDLRYKMKEVINALNHRELVSILYHGQIKGTIIPAGEKIKKKVTGHPFFGMSKGSQKTMKEQMDELRGNRYRDL